MKFSRTLIVSPVPCTHVTGSGALMSSLFRGWPKDSLATIHTPDFESDPRVCDQNYALALPYSGPKWKARVLSITKNQSLSYQQLTDKAELIARRFGPQVVYTYALGDLQEYALLAKSVAGRLGVPYVLHMMDDWPERQRWEYERDGRREQWTALDLQWRELFGAAAKCLGISPEMKSKYRKQYGIDFEPTANSIDFEAWTVFRDNYPPSTERPFRVVYVGAVSEAKELESLKLVHKAIEQLRHKGLEIEWTIYSSPAWEKNIEQHLLGPPWVRFGGCVSELPAVLAEADLLLLALNFDELSRRYLGVSIQNKVPEYMASGTPVLAVGPADNPSIDYAKRERWGLVVDRPDVNQIEIALQQLHQDGDLRRQLGILARDLAIKNHGRAATQQRFVSALHEAIRGG